MTATTSIRIAIAAAFVAAAAMITGATMPAAAGQAHSLHAQVASTVIITQKASPVTCCDE